MEFAELVAKKKVCKHAYSSRVTRVELLHTVPHAESRCVGVSVYLPSVPVCTNRFHIDSAKLYYITIYNGGCPGTRMTSCIGKTMVIIVLIDDYYIAWLGREEKKYAKCTLQQF